MKSILKPLLIAASLVCAVANAAESEPEALMRKITDDVIEIVKVDKDIKSGDTRRAMELVETRVLPNFNFLRMTQLAVGKNWRQASPEQQTQLADEFRRLLVKTYSKALTQYKNQSVTFKPITLQAGQTDVKVRSEVVQPGQKPILIDYYLEKSTGAWRVYDLEVAGVSLVTNYRESFNTEIRTNGIDGLIASLRDKNKAPDTTTKAKP